MRRLNGWEPAEVTSFEYDDAGRLVRQVTVREPEFTDAERTRLLAARRWKASLNRFGIPWHEATDPSNQFAFEGTGPVTDWSEKAFEDHKSHYYDQWKDANRNGHTFNVRKRR